MTQEVVKQTESLAYYIKSTKHTNAVNILIEQKKPPKDLVWDELSAFHRAKLAAEQTRFDYWFLALQIWRATWGQYFKEEGQFGFKQHSPDGYEGQHTPEYCWDADEVYFGFEKENSNGVGYVILAMQFDLAKLEVRLRFSVQIATSNDPDYAMSNNLSLGDLWKKDPDEDYRESKHGLARLPTKAGDEIDLIQLRNAANIAVEAMAAELEA
jgi:hypothetical protein